MGGWVGAACRLGRCCDLPPFVFLWPERPLLPGRPCHLVAIVRTAGQYPSGDQSLTVGETPLGLADRGFNGGISGTLSSCGESPVGSPDTPTSSPSYNREAAAGLPGFEVQPRLFRAGTLLRLCLVSSPVTWGVMTAPAPLPMGLILQGLVC